MSYSRNMNTERNTLLKKDKVYYELRWKMCFPYDDDECVFAHCYPYTYTDLKADIREVMGRSRHLPIGSVKCEKLCSTLAGNTCFTLTITDPAIPDTEKYAAVFTARVHPGETVGSWNMKGLMEFLTHSRNTKARELRRRFVFKLVPMMNADGVIVGNYRCSLAGRDVNRTYTLYGPDRVPEVHHTRKLVAYCRQRYKDVIFCDFHGHSQAFNAFIYGTDSGYRCVNAEGVSEPPKTYLTNPKQYLVDRMIPFLISKQEPRRFSFRSCRFALQPWREGCARIALWRKFNITHCFTMETSLFGTNLEPGSGLRYFDRGDLQDLGQSVALALLEFHEIQSDASKYTQVLLEMGRTLLHEIMLARLVARRNHACQGQQSRSPAAGQLANDKVGTSNIASVDDFARAFNQLGDFLMEDDEIESSSASDTDSVHEFDSSLKVKTKNVMVDAGNDNRARRKPRRRRRRKCRRRRKNRRRRLRLLKALSADGAQASRGDQRPSVQATGQLPFDAPPPPPVPRSASKGPCSASRSYGPASALRIGGRKPSSRTVLKLPLRSPSFCDLETTRENQSGAGLRQPIGSVDVVRRRFQRFLRTE